MAFLKRKSKPLPRFGKATSPSTSDVIARMDDDRVYSITDDLGRPIMNGLQMKGRLWKKMDADFKEHYQRKQA